MRASTVNALSLLLALAEATSCPRAKNFIYIVPDGYGIASQTLARDYYNIMNGASTVEHPISRQIGADPMVMGTVRTQSSDALITDSAASATAFACGIKTYNGAIAVDDDGMPVGSVLEAAHLDGFKTGLVVTSRITHATPACYVAHVLQRDSENEIAAQEVGYSHPLGSVVDILMGGGRRHFLPSEDGGRREDGLNLVEWAEGEGWTYASDYAGFTGAMEDSKLPLPFLGLFSSSHMSYELDRDPAKEPSLLEMAQASIMTLDAETKHSHKGYFIMIEASRIDHAGHQNDPAGHVHDTLMYNDVMDWVKDWISEHHDTQMLSAADHECGGLTLEDNYDPTVIARATKTVEYVSGLYDDYEGDDLPGYLETELLPLLGVTNVTDEMIAMFISVADEVDSYEMGIAIGNVMAEQAGVHWSTDYHTAADVLLHGFAEGHRLTDMKVLMATNHDNTELPSYIQSALHINVQKATDALRADGVDWVEKRDQFDHIKREANRHSHNHMH